MTTRPSMLYDIRSNKAVVCRAIDYPIIGKPILEVSRYVGSYGMGGAGFLGFRLKNEGDAERWLVCTVWGADNWMTIDGRVIHCHLDQAEALKPLCFNWAGQSESYDHFTPMFENQPIILKFEVTQRTAVLGFNDTLIEFAESPDRRPPFPSGTRRELAQGDDLRNAWIITNTCYIDI